MNELDGPVRPGSGPRAYFLTFACYGARLHGSGKGSVDRSHNAIHTRMLSPNPGQHRAARERMCASPTCLNPGARDIALRAIKDACSFRSWILHAAHVRGNHVHVVVGAQTTPSFVLQRLKMRMSVALNNEFGKQRWWARHGSTIWLWNPERVNDAVNYTWNQDEPMARYLNPNRWEEYKDHDM